LRWSVFYSIFVGIKHIPMKKELDPSEPHDGRTLQRLLDDANCSKADLARAIESNRAYVSKLTKEAHFTPNMRKRIIEGLNLDYDPFRGAAPAPQDTRSPDEAWQAAVAALQLTVKTQDELIHGLKYQVKLYRSALIDAQKQGFEVNDPGIKYRTEKDDDVEPDA